MESYWVTFRLDADAGYSKRYNALLEALGKVRGQGGSWGEPTSFWLVQSTLGIDAFTKTLASGLNAKTDLLVVRFLAKDDSRYFGNVEHLGVLKTFMPNIKKLP